MNAMMREVQNIDHAAQNYENAMAHYILCASGKKDANVLREILLNTIFDKSNLQDIWLPIDFPWLTARILLCLDGHMEYDREIVNAVVNLVNGFDQKVGWKSLSPEWVSNEESNSVCIDALLSYLDKIGDGRDDAICVIQDTYKLCKANLPRAIECIYNWKLGDDILDVRSHVFSTTTMMKILIYNNEKNTVEYFRLLDALDKFIDRFLESPDTVSTGQNSMKAQLLHSIFTAIRNQT